jgi:hypothetical protein
VTDKPKRPSRRQAIRAIGKPKPSAREVAARLRREAEIRRAKEALAAMDITNIALN